MQCGIALGGCGFDAEALIGADLPPETAAEGEAWPRLADAPPAPTPGAIEPGAPDPAFGREIQARLATEAAVSAARAEALSGPVIPEAETRRLRAAAQ